MVRLRGLLILIVTVLMLGASSQAEVCELMCGLHVEDDCHSAASNGAEQIAGQHAHCGHEMAGLRQAGPGVLVPDDSDCNHASVPDFVKGGSTLALFSKAQWVVVDIVPVGLNVFRGGWGVVGRPPLLLGWVNPLSVSLRV